MDSLLRRLLLLGWAFLTVGTLHAQTLSPGRLAKSHGEIEGLTNCTKCHELGSRLDGKLCLECHEALRKRVEAKRGLHWKAIGARQGCLDCHKDHRGEDAALTDWGGPKEQWDHALSSWPLTGKHTEVKCQKCHTAQRVTEGDLKKRFQNGKPGTYLGLGQVCAGCHFDEHRGQLKGACDKCHDTKEFKPAPRFDHAEKYPLRGAHVRITCVKCHEKVSDTKPHPASLPPLDPRSFFQYKNTPKTCVECHKDAHEGAFGKNCARCHTERDWHDTRVNQNAPSFHDKSRFPLVGLHREAACNGCHPTGPKGKLQLKGFPFLHCGDCHADAHFGQFKKDVEGFVKCERCHDESGFMPTSYPLADHQEIRFTLSGAHASVACNGCHALDQAAFGPLVPKKTRDLPGKPVHEQKYDFTRILLPDKELKTCEGCHKDPHAGQFAVEPNAKTCTTCHELDSFKDVEFEHNRDSRFTLEGAHTKVTCVGCHRPDDGGSVVYRGAPMTCTGCHQDIHLAQFAAQGAPVDCKKCHTNMAFKPSLFSHSDLKFTTFILKGKHQLVTCQGCHPQKRLGELTQATWYRGVPRHCEGCHVNAHAEGTP